MRSLSRQRQSTTSSMVDGRQNKIKVDLALTKKEKMETEARKRDRVVPRPGPPSCIVYNVEEASALLHLPILPAPQRLANVQPIGHSRCTSRQNSRRECHIPPLAQGLEVYQSDGKQTAFGKSWSYHSGHCLSTFTGNWPHHLSTMASAMGQLPAKQEAAHSLRSRTLGLPCCSLEFSESHGAHGPEKFNIWGRVVGVQTVKCLSTL